MDSLFNKYRKQKLTVAELQEFRDVINRLDDDEVARILDECDQHDADRESLFELPVEVVARMRRKCFEKAGIVQPRHTSRWLRPVAWAAAVMIPLLTLSTVYLFMQSRDYKDMAETDIAIMTGEGERVTTVLPDGTKVELNYLSELRYAMCAFSGDQRNVRFSGEGFFDVAKNDHAPFVISARNLEVTVRGTVFNLQAREYDEFAQLYLESGCVELKSNHETVRLNSGQMARLNYATGDIEVTDAGDSAWLSWRTGDLIFHNETLERVIDTLAKNYNYTIDLNVSGSGPASRFTGRIPSNNLNEALGILEYAYNLEAHISGHTVTLTD